jgi:hypothetical protein
MTASIQARRGSPSRGAIWTDVVLFDPDHRQPAAFGVQRVSRPGGGLLLGEQFLAGNAPFTT